MNLSPIVESPRAATGPERGQETGGKLVPAGRFRAFFLVTALFFLWGIPNNLNDILIRQFGKSFAINRLEAGLVQSAFYLGYFVLAIPAGLLMRRAGYKAGILTGLLLFGSGCWLFWPAAEAGKYWFFLLALFVIASGLSFLETASNPFIAQLGASSSSERRLNLSQAFNPLGGMTGVLIGTALIFSGVELNRTQIALLQAQGKYAAYLQTETFRVLVPYLVLGTIAFIWAVLVWQTPFPDVGIEDESAVGDSERDQMPLAAAKGAGGSLLSGNLVLAVMAEFLYVGSQVGIWSYFIPYIQSYTGLREKTAGFLLTGTMVAFGAGRFFSAWLLRYANAAKLLGIYAIANVVLVLVAVLQPGWLGVICVLVISFFMSMMFPTIFALGIKGLGEKTKTGGSLLVMSIVGGAVLTPLMGKLSDSFGVATAYLVPAGGFVGIALFAWVVARRESLRFMGE